MKVVLINGSPNKKGCTFTALSEVEKELNAAGVETEVVHIGNKEVQGCTACWACSKTGYCVFKNDMVNDVIDKIKEADGVVLGSPVYYAGISGQVKSFLDRVFFAGRDFSGKGKVGASVVSCRRGGASSAFDQMNHYFTISGMPVASSNYWNQVHGNTPSEVIQDLEGMQTMRVLGRNMAWLIKCIQAGKAQGINVPEKEDKIKTNFIR